jgi:hypothetical protein
LQRRLKLRAFGSALFLYFFVALRPSHAAPQTDAPVLDPNATEWPASSLIDASHLLDAPAGRHGFLGGSFVFEDGTPARFWGLNVAAESVFQPHERIDAAIAAIQRAGFNLVRLHHVDDTRGLLDPAAQTSQALRTDRLETLDYWIARLKERGIYVYLDLLDYRAFTTADGVDRADELGRGAKPYALFDPRLIELQQIYARRLLREHVNPYTGLAYADDPAVALVELYDENGLFIKRSLWPRLVEPYRTRLRALWNDYLREVHSDTARLRRAWTRPDGFCALQPPERLEDGTVELPRLSLAPEPGRGQSPLTAEARMNDAARFAYTVHVRYYQDMKAFLRQEVGLRVPLTAVGDSNILPDLKAVADELDFIGLNFYWDHPIFQSGRDWQMPFFFTNQSPLRNRSERTFMPAATVARVAGRPLVLREWNYCYPNDFRSAGVLEATAYACLQDFDALILFTYGLRDDQPPVGYFDVRRDPTRWGLAALGAEIFLGRAIAPARRRVEIGYSDVDTFRFFQYLNDSYHLGWVSQVANRFFPRRWRATADLTVASGRSAAGQYFGGPCLLFRRDDAVDLYGHPATPGRNGMASVPYFGYTLVRRPVQRQTVTFTLGGTPGAEGGTPGAEGGHTGPPLLYSSGTTREVPGPWLFSLSHLRHLGLEPVGVAPEADAALGFLDPARGNLVFTTLTPEEALRAALDMLGTEGDGRGRKGTEGDGRGPEATHHASRITHHASRITHQFVDRGIFVSDTGELTRDTAAGRLTVATPTLWAVAGRLGSEGLLRAGDLTVSTPNPTGTLVALSRDGQPLVNSQRYVIKMVTTAANTGQDWQEPSAPGNPRSYWRLGHAGQAPVVTGGEPSPAPTILQFGRTRLLEVYLRGGTFELERDGPRWRFYCDTPGTRFVLHAAPSTAPAQVVRADGTMETLPSTRVLTYPAPARVVEVGE